MLSAVACANFLLEELGLLDLVDEHDRYDIATDAALDMLRDSGASVRKGPIPGESPYHELSCLSEAWVNDARKDVAAARADLDRAQERIAEVERERDMKPGEFSARLAVVSAKLVDAERDRDTQKARAEKAEAAFETTHSNLATAEEVIAQLDTFRMAIANLFDPVLYVDEGLIARVTAMRERLAAYESAADIDRVARVVRKVAGWTEDAPRLAERLGTLLRETRAELDTQRKVNSDLNCANEALREQHIETESDRDTQKARAEKAEAELAEVRDSYGTAMAGLRVHRDNVETWRKMACDSKLELDDLRAKLTAAEAREGELQTLVTEMERDHGADLKALFAARETIARMTPIVESAVEARGDIHESAKNFGPLRMRRLDVVLTHYDSTPARQTDGGGEQKEEMPCPE